MSYGRKRTVPIPQLVAPPTQIVNPAPRFVIGTKMPLRRFDCASESHQSSVSSFRRRPESRGVGRGECSAGACPPLGRRGAWQNPRCQFAVPSHNSSSSYLGVPAPAGVSDCYESMSRTPIRDRLLQQPLSRHSRHPFVNPAPHSSFRRSKACPVPRYGAGIQEGWGGVSAPDDGKNRPVTPFSSSYAAAARPW